MLSALQIRQAIVDYLSDKMDFDQFDEWFAQNTWNIREKGDRQSQDLAYSVESKIAEFSGGFVSENILRRNLSPFVTNYVFQSDQQMPPPLNSFGGVNWQTVVVPRKVEEFAVGIRPLGLLS